MKLPILAYGHPLLKQQCNNIERDYPNLDTLITDLWETMRNAGGCGLAAPQIGHTVNLFVVDSKATFENLEKEDRRVYFDEHDTGIQEVFINADIVSCSEELWTDEEGCLSIPDLRRNIQRPWGITMKYYNTDFEQLTKVFSGTTARMIQHEYDHTQGILYLDYLKPLTKLRMESKLRKIVKGLVPTAYPMKFV